MQVEIIAGAKGLKGKVSLPVRAGRDLNGQAGTDSGLRGAPVQNIPFGLARGIFGASNGAEFFGSPTTCKVSQCSIALPSASIL